GLAWTGNGRITMVEVSTDGGRTWQPARLEDPILAECPTRFTLPWRWEGQEAVLQSRCTDETGYVQPTRQALIAVRGLNSVYHYHAIQSWKVARDGRISNVQV
ncbi:MAG: sulfite dehydrogenase, partial [Nitrospiraceae bacterium]